MCQNRKVRSRNDHRGMSFSVFTVVIFAALILVAGLVVDGAAQLAEHRRVQVVAAQSVRVGSDAAAGARLTGSTGARQALESARDVLWRSNLDGRVELDAGTLIVTTTSHTDTTFLGLIGVDHLAVEGHAEGELIPD